MGLNIQRQAGIDILSSYDLIKWGHAIAPFKTLHSVKNFNAKFIFNEINTPELILVAVNKADHKISANAYSKKDWKNAVQASTYLTSNQKQQYWYLLEKYSNIFQGKLGTFPGPKYHLNLDPGSTPFCSKLYSILHYLKPLAKQEIDRLVNIGVLRKIVNSRYGAPCIFQPKKNG